MSRSPSPSVSVMCLARSVVQLGPTGRPRRSHSQMESVVMGRPASTREDSISCHSCVRHGMDSE